MVHNWGNYPKFNGEVFEFRETDEAKHLLETHECVLAKGNGRAYGDAGLASKVIRQPQRNKILRFDDKIGTVTCEAGLLLKDLLKVMIPKGFFFEVTPGTSLITVGGAIAADVHGKNHHNKGCFSQYLIEFLLLRGNGEVCRCSRSEHPDLFRATCGGMGLTGIILQASFELKKLETAYVLQKTIKTSSLQETLSQLEHTADSSYSVAWIDCLANGDELGRGLINIGEHATLNDLPSRIEKPLSFDFKAVKIPFYWPSFTLNNWSIKLFNQLYYRKKAGSQLVHLNPFFYPLDRLGNWYKIYGKKGFTQYQCVLPKGKEDVLREILELVRKAGLGSFLAVLKLLGKANDNYLSFPMEGYTLSLDFPIRASLFPLLDEMDKLVMKAKGRLYLAKDARMSSDFFFKSYFRAKDFQLNYLGSNPKFMSMQAKRLFGLST